MAKKTKTKLTPEEKKEIIKLPLTEDTLEIIEGVFKILIQGVKGEIDKKISAIIYGGIIATVLIIITLWWSTQVFMGSYQQNFLNTQTTINEQINALRKENEVSQLRLNYELKQIQEEQKKVEQLFIINQ